MRFAPLGSKFTPGTFNKVNLAGYRWTYAGNDNMILSGWKGANSFKGNKTLRYGRVCISPALFTLPRYLKKYLTAPVLNSSSLLTKAWNPYHHWIKLQLMLIKWHIFFTIGGNRHTHKYCKALKFRANLRGGGQGGSGPVWEVRTFKRP